MPQYTGNPMLVFCPNLAVDHILELDGIVLGDVQHSLTGSLSAGGKGLNVARAAARLGVTSNVVGLVAGATGSILRSLVARESINVESPALHMSTRIATILVDRAAGTTTVVNERGPTVTAEDWAAMASLVHARVAAASVLVCTGSLLPGVGPEGYVEFITSGRNAGVPVIVDASGPVLWHSAAGAPDIVKANLAEAELAFGPTGPSSPTAALHRAVRAAGLLASRSGRIAIVTIAGGAAVASEKRVVFYHAPRVRVHSDVGAGDAFLAGLAAGLLRGGDVWTACRRAVAAASASIENGVPGLLERARVNELEELVTIERQDLRRRGCNNAGSYSSEQAGTDVAQ